MSDDVLDRVAERFRNAPEADRPSLRWPIIARPEQLPPPRRWRAWYVRGGRGSGKTATGSGTLAGWIAESWDDPGEWGIMAPTYSDAWGTCVEGESGLLAQFGTTVQEVRAGESKWIEHWHRSWAELRFRNGSIVRVASADDGGLRIQGKNLRGAWADEIGLWDAWEVAWDESLAFAVRLGEARIVGTGTPKISRKARELIRRLLEDPEVPVSTLKTLDNAENLSDDFVREVVARNRGTRLERQELEGELIEDVEGALWNRDLIDRGRVSEMPRDWSRVIVAVDPSDGKASGDEQAIAVVGRSAQDGEIFVLGSEGMHETPWRFLSRAVELTRRWNATLVVEKNHGSEYLVELLEQLLRRQSQRVPYQTVTATKGKMTRAEPIAALYERGRVHHVGTFPELEDQLCTFTGAANEHSPDRLDALVWALWPFLDDVGAARFSNELLTKATTRKVKRLWNTSIGS
jgi:predicted phage terminase large subunit-like protein